MSAPEPFVFDWQAAREDGAGFLKWFLPTVMVGATPDQMDELTDLTSRWSDVRVQVLINGVEVNAEHFLQGVERNLEATARDEARRMLDDVGGLDALEERRHAAYQGSGVLDPLTRLIMLAEELDAAGAPENLAHPIEEMAQVLREVYGDLKRVLDTVHPGSAYVGDRVRASWEIWEDGNFVEKVTKEGVVTHASVPGKNFITFLDDGTGLTHGPLVHNYEVTERFKPKDED